MDLESHGALSASARQIISDLCAEIGKRGLHLEHLFLIIRYVRTLDGSTRMSCV